MKLTTAEQMKELDRQAIEERGIPSIDLMERAAAGVAEAALALLPKRPGKCRGAALCGAGNNCGDGIAAARLLFLKGLKVRAFLVGDYEKLTPDALEETRRLSECGVELERFDPADESQRAWVLGCDVVIDALFGVGLSRPIGAGTPFAAAVDWMNESRAAVVAADIASGVSADTGAVLGRAVRADRTVTFTLPKIGQAVGEGAALSGNVEVRDIGIPADSGPGPCLPGPDGGAGLCPCGPAAPEGGRPQGNLRQGADRRRRSGLYRCALSHCRGGGADRVRAGVPGGAGDHLAGGGGQVRLCHAIPSAGQTWEALSQGERGNPGAGCRL